MSSQKNINSFFPNFKYEFCFEISFFGVVEWVIHNVATKNLNRNKNILPHIVDLINGSQNAQYTSKGVQNKIINIAANLVRDDFRKCLELTPQFALMADERTSQGKEVLSICLCLLDLSDPSKPTKGEVL